MLHPLRQEDPACTLRALQERTPCCESRQRKPRNSLQHQHGSKHQHGSRKQRHKEAKKRQDEKHTHTPVNTATQSVSLEYEKLARSAHSLLNQVSFNSFEQSPLLPLPTTTTTMYFTLATVAGVLATTSAFTPSAFVRTTPVAHKATTDSSSALSMKYKVAVVGGGPSGACAAEIFAQEKGIDTVLFERKLDNAKPCGGAIPLCMVGEFDIPETVVDRKVRCCCCYREWIRFRMNQHCHRCHCCCRRLLRRASNRSPCECMNRGRGHGKHIRFVPPFHSKPWPSERKRERDIPMPSKPSLSLSLLSVTRK